MRKHKACYIALGAALIGLFLRDGSTDIWLAAALILWAQLDD